MLDLKSSLIWSFSLVMGASLLGCQTFTHPSVEYSKRIEMQSEKIRKQTDEIERLRNENEILRSKMSNRSGPKGKSKRSEGVLYRELVRAYRGQQETEVAKLKTQLLRDHPAGSYADNALFFAALSHLRRGRYGEALQDFDQLIQKYPKSEKLAAALLGKGQVYARLNLTEKAKEVFRQVVMEHPGSVPAEKAVGELRRLE